MQQRTIIMRAVSYDCKGLYEIKQKAYTFFKAFDPRKADPRCILTKRAYWQDYFGIHPQTISMWHKASRTSQTALDLRYAFFMALLVESTRQRARYFMAVAGHPYKDLPTNFVGYNKYEDACFRIIDNVYEKYEIAEWIEDQTVQKARLDLAREIIIAREDDLYILWFDS